MIHRRPNPDAISEMSPSPSTQADQISRLRNFVLFALVAWLLVGMTYKGAVSPQSGIAGVDFASFYQAAVRLNAGQPLYQPALHENLRGSLYVYSPLLAELLRPLAHLPFQRAMKVWFFVNAASLILAILLYGAALRTTWRSIPLLCLLLLVSFHFWDSTMDFGVGQSDFLLVGLVGAMLWADSRKLWKLLGALIALAALVKVWMLGLLLYPLLRRDTRTVYASIGVFMLAQTVLFSLVGWHQFPAYLRCMAEAKAFGEHHGVMNSVLGFAGLHLRANSIVLPLINNRFVYLSFVALCGAGLLWGFKVIGRVLKSPTPFEACLSFVVVLVSVLLLMPTYENGYFVFCLPLLWALLASPDADAKPVSRVMLAGGILIYLVFVRGWPVYAPFPPFLHHGLRSLIVSMNFYGTVALWGLGLYALKKSADTSLVMPAPLPIPSAIGSGVAL